MRYTICFYGSCEIEAKNLNEATGKFWECIAFDNPLPMNQYEIENVEDEEGDVTIFESR